MHVRHTTSRISAASRGRRRETSVRVSVLAALALFGAGVAGITTAPPAAAASEVIFTVAGTGEPGYNGDNIPATTAQLTPGKMAFDSSGNLYITDGHRIRKVSPLGIITTVAGTGEGGFNGDGILATDAQLNEPTDVTVDGAGNLFISEDANARVRRVDAVTGIITTVAGNGSPGFSGDGGPATDAQLNRPRAVTLDSAGNLFISDYDNSRIRRVDAATGIITTVVGVGGFSFGGDGGPATAANINGATDVAFDAAGNLLIADSDNCRIRKVDTAGIITTVAGNGDCGYSGDGGPATEAAIGNPQGLSLDADGNMYFASVFQGVVRKVNTSGIITTVAGGGSPPDGLGDGLPAIQAAFATPGPFGTAVSADGVLYIADTFHHRVRAVQEVDDLLRITKSDSPDPGATGETLTYAMTVTNTGDATATDVTVTDDLPSEVTFVSASSSQGTCSEASGTVTCDLGDLDVGASASVEISVTPNLGGTITNTATVAAAEADPFLNNNSATTSTEVIAPDLLSLSKNASANPATQTNPLTYNLAVANNHTNDAATGVTLTDTLPPSVTFGSATPSQGTCSEAGGTVTCELGDLALGATATVEVVVTPNDVATITNTASVAANEADLVPDNNTASVETEVIAPDLLALSMSHTMINMEAVVGKPFSYILDVVNNDDETVGDINLEDNLPPSLIVNSVSSSQGICTQSTNAVFCDLGDLAPGASAKVGITVTPGQTGMITNTATVDGFNTPDPTPANNTASVDTFVTDDPNAMFVVGGHPNGFTGDGEHATATHFERAGNLAVDAAGNIYVAGDEGNGRLLRIDLAGIVTTFAGTGTPGFSGDNGPATSAQIRSFAVAVDGSGNVYISEEQNHRIRKVDTSGIITTFAGTGTPGFSGDNGPATSAEINGPQGIATDAAGNVYFSERGNRRIRKVDTSGVITTIAGNGTADFADNVPATTTGLARPYDVAVGPAGDVFVTDLEHFRIRKVDPAGIITTFAGSGAPFGCNPATHDGQPATSVPLRSPTGLEVDAVGNVYFTTPNCGSNGSLHRVDTAGRFSTLVPRFENFALPYGLALSPGGETLYIAQPDALRQVLGLTVADLLALEKEAVNVAVGDATWELTVTNRGLVGATGVTLTDTLPPGVVFQSAEPSQGSCTRSGNEVTCELGALAPGEVARVTIEAAPAEGEVGTTTTNTATVTQNEPDPAPANNTATTETFVSGEGCGSTIKKDTTLTADIGPCDRDGVIIGKNGIKLDLNGHRIFGTPGPGPDGSTVGIRLPNRKDVTIKGPGTVSDFDAGVFVNGGRGRNVIKRLTVRDNVGILDTFLSEFGDGIVVFNSGRNEIMNNKVIHNGPYNGIGVFGQGSNGNRIKDNVVRGTVGDGGPNGQGIIVSNFIDTFGLPLIENNVVRGNKVMGNDGAGISNVNTKGSQVLNNVVERNGFNTSRSNGNGIGVTLGPGVPENHTNALVQGNQVHGNAHFGIQLTRPNFSNPDFFSIGNRVIDNDAADNGVETDPVVPYFDLFDRAPDCADNVWSGNIWGSGGFSPECTTTGGSGPLVAAAQAADGRAADGAATTPPSDDDLRPRRRPS